MIKNKIHFSLYILVYLFILSSCLPKNVSIDKQKTDSNDKVANIHSTKIVAENQIKGYIDSVVKTSSGNINIRGWACDKNVSQSIEVRLYLDGSAGKGTYIGPTLAKRSSENAVSSACNSTINFHRYQFTISNQQWKEFAGKAVYVHGISTSGGANNLLTNSGRKMLPQYDEPKIIENGVIGNIENVSLSQAGGVNISGWACDKNVKKSIGVHLYLGGSAGRGGGTFFKSIIASQPSGTTIKNRCSSGLLAHRYRFTMSNQEWKDNTGKKVYIHGISASGGDNKLLSNSGTNSIPVYPTESKKENEVIGNIENVSLSQTGGVNITGWACDRNVKKSIGVHLYLGGAAGRGGAILLGIMANKSSDANIKNTCNSGLLAHRYQFNITNQKWKDHAGKKVYIHGISASGGSNKLIANSGSYNIPAYPTEQEKENGVFGNIDKVSLSETGGINITGWSCDKNVNKSIDVHMYLGGAAGRGGVFVQRATADLSTDPPGLISSCETNLTSHYFKLSLSKSEWKEYSNEGVFIHGISASSGRNELIANSGTKTIPTFVDSNGIKGRIDSISVKQGILSISGWACAYGINNSVTLKVYSAAGDSSPVLFKTEKASRNAEDAVHRLCGTTTGNHRFLIQTPRDGWKNLRRKKLFLSAFSGNDTASATYISRGAGELSFPNLWMNLSEFNIPNGSDFIVQPQDIVVINQNKDIRHLIIKGQLRCQNSTNSFNLDVKGISVMGKFICGSSSNRFMGKLNIRVKGNYVISGDHGDISERSFAIMNGGEVHFYGKSSNSGMYKITQTAQAGARSIRLDRAANWTIGDMIILASTGFDMNEAERLTITSISSDKKTIFFNQSLRFRHWGQIKNYSSQGRSWVLDERANVANLSRNIKIYPYLGDFDETKIGAHMMSMAGAKAYVDSVEFINMGQLSMMGRYPFHWHKAGNVPGQFIKNSSIRDSYQRCITIHDTNYATVENNVCYNHNGHGIFLEAGSERKNTIKGNLVLVSKKIAKDRALLVSDVAGTSMRFTAPASYWISNPDNNVIDNVAAGSQGTGFWMPFERVSKCNKDLCSIPVYTDTLAFDNNTAHSSRVGMTWDGAPSPNKSANNPLNPDDNLLSTSHYAPKVKAVFNDLKVFKNSGAGIYVRGNALTFNNLVIGDNKRSLFFAYSQHVKNSAVIGRSPNFTNKDLTILANRGSDVAGAVLYDGPLELENVAFFDFPTQEIFHNGRSITPIPIRTIGGHNKFENKSTGLTFVPEPWKRVFMNTDVNGWTDSDYANSLRDLDGSLTGTAGSIVVPINEYNGHPSCIDKISWKAKVCNYDLFLFIFYNFTDTNKTFFIPTAPNGVRAYDDFSDMYRSDGIGSERGYPFHNKFHAIMGDQGFYQIDPGFGLIDKKRFRITGQTEANNMTSPIVRINDMSCIINNYPQVYSLSQLRSLNGTGVFKEGNDTYFKLKTNVEVRFHMKSELSNSHSGAYEFACD